MDDVRTMPIRMLHTPRVSVSMGPRGGIQHGVSPKHLQGYLNEFVFRFNRRSWPLVAFESVLNIAARVKSPTYTQLYKGTWVHPG